MCCAGKALAVTTINTRYFILIAGLSGFSLAPLYTFHSITNRFSWAEKIRLPSYGHCNIWRMAWAEMSPISSVTCGRAKLVVGQLFLFLLLRQAQHEFGKVATSVAGR
jgi:hypothetical protein